MPNKQNAKKALRQAKKHAIINLITKKAYKKAIKETREAASVDFKEKARLAQKALDKAAKKGVIKKNSAARRLSRLMKKAKQVVNK